MEKNSGRARMEKRHSVVKKEEKKNTPIFVKYGLIALAAIVVIVAGVFLSFKLSESYVATVGNEKITTKEYKFYLTLQKQNMLYIAQKADPNLNVDTFWNTKISGSDTALEYAKKKALDTLQDTKVQLAKAKDSNVKLTSAEIKRIDDYIKTNIIDASNIGGGSRSKAEKYLMDNFGCGINDFRNIQIEQAIIGKYSTAEIDKIKVADTEIKDYYDKHPDWYKQTTSMRIGAEEALWASHILIKADSSATQEVKDTAKKKAQDLLDKLKAGEDFATLAKANTEDNYTDYVFGKGQMDTNFETAAFSLNPGQLYDGLVQSAYGYHIIKLNEKYAKDQPISLKCATENWEFGTGFIKKQLYQAKLAEWKKDAKYNLKKADSVYNSIS